MGSEMCIRDRYRAHIEGAVATQMADSDDADQQQAESPPEEPQEEEEEKEPQVAAQGGWRQASRRRDIGTGRGFFMPRDVGDKGGGPMYWYESNSCCICFQFVPIFSQAQCCNVPAHSDCVAVAAFRRGGARRVQTRSTQGRPRRSRCARGRCSIGPG